MESLLARALESKLKYWLKSFTRDQFKLQGRRTVQLCGLDINGEVLHAAIGLPTTLGVTEARIGRLELRLPPFSNVQVEPIVVDIDKLDLILTEKSRLDSEASSLGSQGTPVTKSNNSYGYADKIADGMTVKVGILNLMLETHGGTDSQGGAEWIPPLASITIRDLMLYTTDENWKVVNLKEARDFSSNKKAIYVFKKLKWASLSVDLLPHPDMFNDERLMRSDSFGSKRDDAGVKRLFFGGERFLDNISGEAYITMHRTEQNNPLGLEVQVNIPEAVCPALSEPGLRALLRFMTGVYVCMNRGDISSQHSQSAEAAGRTMVGVVVRHIFLCIKDAEFQLEFLLQCLQYLRTSASFGESTKTMTRVSLGGLFLRETFSHPPCTLVQPSIHNVSKVPPPVPNFANTKLWPRIYPLEYDWLPSEKTVPLLHMYSLQTVPSPAPPALASQTVFQCQPLKINLQEDSCLRIASFLADSVVVEPGVVVSDTSIQSMYFSLKEFDLTIPVSNSKHEMDTQTNPMGFTGARLHVEGFVFASAPSLNLKLLNLDKDPACFSFWPDQPADASQKKWVMRANTLSISLETEICNDLSQSKNPLDWSSGLWHCVDILEPCIEAAMVTSDGCPLLVVPPPGGIVRVGVYCREYTSNASVEQLFFVLRMYEYIGNMIDALVKLSKTKASLSLEDSRNSFKSNKDKKQNSFGEILEMAPGDTAINLCVDILTLKFLDSDSDRMDVPGEPLVQVFGHRLSLKVNHRTLGGAIAITSKLGWQDIAIALVETDVLACAPNSEDVLQQGPSQNSTSMRTVFWVGDKKPGLGQESNNPLPFLDIDVTNVIPSRLEDVECHSLSVKARVFGVHLGGGMVYNENLLHRFGILGPDGGPGKEIKRILKKLSTGPLADLLRPTTSTVDSGDGDSWELGIPEDIDIDLQLLDWRFVLEGAENMPNAASSTLVSLSQEERCWHSTFACLGVYASGKKKDPPHNASKNGIDVNHPVQTITVTLNGLKVIKPQILLDDSLKSLKTLSNKGEPMVSNSSHLNHPNRGGLDIEVRLIMNEFEEDSDAGLGEWVVESLRASVKKPVEIEATKMEVEHLVKTFKLELESASRIAAGVMQLLQLQGSFGQATIQQLNSFGSGSLSLRQMPSQELRRRSSIGSVCGPPSSYNNADLPPDKEEILETIRTSKDVCKSLSARLSDDTRDPSFAKETALLSQQLDRIEALLLEMRTSN